MFDENSKANQEAAMWLAFVVIGAAADAAIAGLLVWLFKTPLLWAVMSGAPIGAFFGAMFALITPLRRAVNDLISMLLAPILLLLDSS